MLIRKYTHHFPGEVKYVGAYSQYCVADERISFKVPQGISREQASTVPLAAATAWLALLSKECLALDRSKAKSISVLVWGGSCKYLVYGSQMTAKTKGL